MKKLLRISLALTLSCCLVGGYAGISVFKMICLAEQGKVVISFTDVRNTCTHEQTTKSCCTPQSAPKQQQVDDHCCAYSYQYCSLEDQSVTSTIQNSTNHYLPITLVNQAAYTTWYKLAMARVNQVKPPDPPPGYPPNQPHLSFIQTYLI